MNRAMPREQLGYSTRQKLTGFLERMTFLLLICDVFETCLITKILQRRWTAAWRWVSPINISFRLKLGGMFVFQSHLTRCIGVVQHSGWGFFVLGVFFFGAYA